MYNEIRPSFSHYEFLREPLMSAPFEPNSINIIKMKEGKAIFFLFLFFFRSRCLLRCTPARHCCLAEGTCSSAQKQMLFPADGKAISVLGGPEVCISLTSPAQSAPFVYLALMFPECFPALFPTSPLSRAVASSSYPSSPSSAVITEVLLWATGGSIYPAACCLAELETIPSAAFRSEPVGACQGCCFDVAALFFFFFTPNSIICQSHGIV